MLIRSAMFVLAFAFGTISFAHAGQELNPTNDPDVERGIQ
jgi:hypothetical protein